MLRIVACLVGLLFGASQIGALNPSFDKETLALQLAMTDWKSRESIFELIQVLQDQIPMNVSDTCREAVRNFVFDLMQKEMYAVTMVDAFGKTPSGITLGHLLIFGHFDQCLAVRRYNATTGMNEQAANYCLVRLHEPKLAARLPALPAYGACLPLECSNKHDAEAFITGLFKPLRAAADLTAVKAVCVTPLPKSIGFYVMIVICVLLVLVIIAASVVHCAFRRRYDAGKNGTELPLQPSIEIYKDQKMSTNGLTITQHTEITKKSKFGYANVPLFLRPLLCFHIPTNIHSIGAMASDGEIAFLHGFRVLSMWWIILGHTYYLGMNFISNRLMMYIKVRTLPFQIIVNAGYAVDSFFLLSGLLITYVLVREMSKNNGKLNWMVVYFHRWWRLTPVYVFVMMVYVYVMPHGIESPWKLLIAQEGAPTEHCKTYWWTNILYINNFFPVFRKGQCMNWTWFLALDMQFFMITPIIVFIMYKSYRAGAAIVGVIVVASIATTMAIIGAYNLPIHFFQEPVTYNVTLQNATIDGTWITGFIGNNETFHNGSAPWYMESVYPTFYNNNTDTFDTIVATRGYEKDVDYIYEKPYTRIAPFVIGILLGFMFARVPSFKFSKGGKGIAAVGWIVCTVIALLLLFGFHLANAFSMMPPIQTMSLGARIIYGGLQRFGWSLVAAWILFACNYGYGGYVTSILSMRFWRPFSNLTYGAYLVHMLTLQLYFASQRSMIFYSTINFLTVFLSQIFLAYGVALVFAVLVEVPLLRLERLIIRKSL